MTELGFQPAVKRSLPYLPHLQDRWPYRFGAAASGSHVLVVLYIEIIDADAALALKVFVKDIRCAIRLLETLKFVVDEP